MSGPMASLRGDFGRIVLRAGSNVQDCCVLHSFPDKDALLEEDAHIGHAAVLHGCTIRRGALIGIAAVIMDGAVIEEQAFVGASSFVRAGFVVPARTLVMGVPARVVRELTAEELAWKATGTREYQDLALRCRKSLHECRPLAAAGARSPAPERLGRRAAAHPRSASNGLSVLIQRRIIGAVRVDHPEQRRHARVEEPDALLVQEREQLLRLLIGDDELHLDREGAGEFKEGALVQHVVAPEAGHGAERRAAADPERIGLLEQPLPHQALVVALILVHVEAQK